MTERLEQRYCIKFCQKLGDTQVETIRKIQQAFGDDAMNIVRIREWYNRFKDDSTSVDSKTRHSRPSTSRNDCHQPSALVMQDRRITVRELADDAGVSIGSVHTILTADFGLEESVREIHAEAANDGAEATLPGNRTRHAGLRRK